MQTLILNHYPPAIKQIKDMQQIARAEDIEFSKLNIKTKEVIRNMYVITADETGVRRFEELFGVTSGIGKSLERRKSGIITAINKRKTGLEGLTAMLTGYYKGIRLISDVKNMEMKVVLDAGTESLNEAVEILDELLPLNIYFHFTLRMEKSKGIVTAQAAAFFAAEIKVGPKIEDREIKEGNTEWKTDTIQS